MIIIVVVVVVTAEIFDNQNFPCNDLEDKFKKKTIKYEGDTWIKTKKKL